MGLSLINLQSNQLIKLDHENPIIIGRGNIEGCSNKRVSRSHGKVTCTDDGKIRLLALHCNPCFFTRNGVPPVQQLNKNEEETLNEGDCLGLLPNEYWFKVASTKEAVIIKKEPSDSPTSQNSPSTSSLPGMCQKVTETKKSQELESSASTESSTVKHLGNPELEKTKRLPIWMYEIDEPNISDNSRKLPIADDEPANSKRLKLISESEIKNEPKDDDDIVVESYNLAIPSTSKVENTNECTNIKTESPDELPQKEENNKSEKEGYESNAEEESSTTKRPICQYEGNCYRKNPQHKQEFSHPGDADFVPYEQRPVCPFGSSCYRKNEKHKVEFRHPPPGSSQAPSSPPGGSRASSPLPPKRRRKKIKDVNSDYEDDEDDYDLDDPFINDASSDEYVPSDLESELEDLDESREDD